MGFFTRVNTFLVAVLVVVAVAEAQNNIPACASNLVGCVNYLNSTTKPPSDCCDPLNQAITKQLPCLCTLYNTPGLLKSFGINVTEALRLPSLCGIPGDLNSCQGQKNAGAPTSPSSPASGSGSSTTNKQPSSKNNADRIASTWIFSSLLICATMMFYSFYN